MSVRYDNRLGRKTILAEDSKDSLTDAIADMMLLCGGNEDRLDEAIQQAKGSAEIHYSAESGGDSEGYEMYVDPQDGENKPMKLKQWIAQLPPVEEESEERYTVTLDLSHDQWIILDGGAARENDTDEDRYNSRQAAQDEADRLNATD